MFSVETLMEAIKPVGTETWEFEFGYEAIKKQRLEPSDYEDSATREKIDKFPVKWSDTK